MPIAFTQKLPLRAQIAATAVAAVLVTLVLMLIPVSLSIRKQIETSSRERLMAAAYSVSEAVPAESLDVIGANPNQISAASVMMSRIIQSVWNPDNGNMNSPKDGIALVRRDSSEYYILMHSSWEITTRRTDQRLSLPAEIEDSITNIRAGKNHVYWLVYNGTLMAVAPIYRNVTIPDGLVVAMRDEASAYAEQWYALARLAWFPIIALIISVSLALWLSGHITRRIAILADHARVIASGNLQHEFTHQSGDELGSLADSFRSMTSSLRSFVKDSVARARIEAIGLLASGVAHDFNNILTVIYTESELLLEDLDPNKSQYKDVQEIRKAAERGSALTNQLLAFSREQVLQPRTIILNEAIRNVESMLRRLIPSNINLEISLDDQNDTILIDSSQLEQIVVNLAVNARDAMAEGLATMASSTLTLKTKRVTIEVEESINHITGYLPTGVFVSLIVSDSGCGMDAELQARIFEPFFTTKPTGKGTGLGLATVYTIVRENRGFIGLESKLGVGTTFSIYFPISATSSV